MKLRLTSIVAWFCTLLVTAFMLFSAVMKFFPVVPGSDADQMMQKLGVSGMVQQLGILELIIIILYVIPRTSVVGFVLMIGYVSGALATNLTHGFTHADVLPIYILFVLMMIDAAIRKPELLARIMGRKV